ncbi:MAG TPA: class I SAM-dependent methyltransferase [Terriglobales bacterium]
MNNDQLVEATRPKQESIPAGTSDESSPSVANGAAGFSASELPEGNMAATPPLQEIPLDLLPFPPLEMRELVGPTELAAFDNPNRRIIYDYLEPEVYETVFDFGCGCGRVARQLILQRPSPQKYVGLDLHAGMIRWCQRNLQPIAPHFTFLHHDVLNVRFNPGSEKPRVAPFPVVDAQFKLVNVLSVFTHLTEDQAAHYLGECARILHPEGVLHASWFFFDKEDYPMLQEHTNALYVSYVDPSAAVIFARTWVRNTARQFGLRFCKIVPPQVRGHQWAVVMTKRTDLGEVDFPPDEAPRGVARPPMGSNPDPASIGMEPDLK